jgi:uncharacterized phage protein (TIGR01671 family)
MQDRFKFRFWRFNDVEKKWKQETFADLMSIDGSGLPFDNTEGGAYTEYDTEYITEQCTGLKDNNGKLIYEGDIVEQNRSFYKVIFSYDDVASCGCCVGKFSGCGFVMEDKYGCRGDLDIYSELEIIGNIHENPDLLENKDEYI